VLLERVLHVTDEHIPFFTSNQLSEYRRALLHVYGIWHQPQRQGNRGRYPKPPFMPPPGLLYAQVVKVRVHDRVVEVDIKVVFGDPKTIAEKLTSLPTSEAINTSYVERNNLAQLMVLTTMQGPCTLGRW